MTAVYFSKILYGKDESVQALCLSWRGQFQKLPGGALVFGLENRFITNTLAALVKEFGVEYTAELERKILDALRGNAQDQNDSWKPGRVIGHIAPKIWLGDHSEVAEYLKLSGQSVADHD